MSAMGAANVTRMAAITAVGTVIARRMKPFDNI